MLPIVGVVALGILILGIRLFFLPASPPVPRAEQLAPSTPSVPSLPAEPTEVVVAPEVGTARPAVVAVPVTDGEEKGSSPKATPSAPSSQPQTTPTVKPAKPVPPPPPPAAVKGSWGVQVGAFTTPAAAEGLAAKLRSSGESVLVVKADVGGKLYYRVRVVAGTTRQDAEKKAMTLKGQGYPTLVVSL